MWIKPVLIPKIIIPLDLSATKEFNYFLIILCEFNQPMCVYVLGLLCYCSNCTNCNEAIGFEEN